MMSERKHPYGKDYLSDACKMQARLFDGLYSIDKHIVEADFINKFMVSRCKELLDHANPRLINATVLEVYDAYYELGGEEPLRVEEAMQPYYAPQQLYWVGLMYEYVHWYYNIPSAQLIDLLPLDTMLFAYVCGHQMGEKQALEYIYDTWLKDKMS